MAKPHEKLAASLTILRKLQRNGHVFNSREFSRVHRERLVRTGFLQEVMKGWLISSSPGARAGDSTPWYASFWEFCARYCAERFGEDWHLSPEQSIFLHAETTVIPSQAVICSPRAHNNKIPLPFGTSLFDLQQPQMPQPADLVTRNGVKIFTAAAAIMKVSETFFVRYPLETQIALASVRDTSELLRRLLDGGHSFVAGRIVGALRRIGRPEAAEEILTTMRAAGYVVRETDPFEGAPVRPLPAMTVPIVGRLQSLWESMRGKVIDTFPPPPGLPDGRRAYLRAVEEIYRRDAYHSLSIEGYKVSPELIERVRAGNWNTDRDDMDHNDRDALAARGYWQAFQSVKGAVGEILAGANAGATVRASHRDWYRELFQPCVGAGLIAPQALAGYRNDAVYLRTSRYVPPRWEIVRDAMPALFDLLENEPEPGVRAVLGHWLFGYIHPYPDGNGRVARFLMNAMLASGGYPWTIVRVEDRADYLEALYRASVDGNIVPFAELMARRVRDTPLITDDFLTGQTG